MLCQQAHVEALGAHFLLEIANGKQAERSRSRLSPASKEQYPIGSPDFLEPIQTTAFRAMTSR